MIKNLHYKIISVLVVLSMLCVTAASAAVTLQPVVTAHDVTLTVQCGTEYANKNVVVQVLEPTGSLESLEGESGGYNVTDAELINSVICCLYHGKTDENGDLTFTFTPTGDKGRYIVRINADGMYAPVDTSIEFVSDDDAAVVIEELVDDLSVENIAAIFEKPENENVYKPYQILNLDESVYYEQYDNADSSLKEAICEYILAGVSDNNDIDAAGFAKLFEDAVLAESLNVLAKEELVEYIIANADALGIADSKEFKNILSNDERFNDAVESEFTNTLADKDLSGKSVDDIADVICDLLLVNALSNTDSPGVLNDIILEFEDELESAGADMDDYNDADKPLEVCRTLIKKQPFASLSDFADELDNATPSGSSGSSSSRPGSPSGGSTGVSYGGAGSSASTPSVSIPVAAEKKELPFADIDSVEWAHEAIIALKEAGIISGKAEGLFAPNDNVTREEFVKMLVLALGLEISTDNAPDFSDVNGDEWFAPYVYTAYNNGIVKGVGDGFGVGANITRQDMAVMCARALELKEVSLEKIREDMTFTDEISDYAYEAVELLWSAGLINGISETEFASTASATRAQAAKLLYEIWNALK